MIGFFRVRLISTLALSLLGCASAQDVTASPPSQAGAGVGVGASGVGPSGTSGTGVGHGGTTGVLDAGGTAGKSAVGMPTRDAGTLRKDAGLPPVADAKVSSMPDGGTKAPVTALRVTTLNLRDPHFYVGGVTDITDQPFLGQSVNGNLIQGGLTMDYDGDGFLDLSFMLLFQPLDPAASNAQLRLTEGNCLLKTPTQCAPKPQTGLNTSWTIDNQAQGACLTPVAGTTAGYTPAVGVPMGPCFVTATTADLIITLAGIAIPLTSARLAGSYDPANRVMTGLISGFLTKTKAMQAVLPSYLGLLAGFPISDFLIPSDADLAKSPTGEDGYWLYVNFVAEPVEYTP